MNELNKKLRDRAIELGLCKQWKGEWDKDRTQDELIKMWKKGSDFCFEKHDFPNKEFIKAYFDRKVLNDNLVFVDEIVNITNGESGTWVINGNCTGNISFGGFAAARLYVRHDCDVSIDVSGMSKVFVSVYNNAKVNVKQSGSSKVYVYKKSPSCEVDLDGDVMAREGSI
jgi:hypothetical protein